MLRRGGLVGAMVGALCLVGSSASAEILQSASYPLQVHFEDPAHADFAAEVLARVEESWAFQVEGLGFLPPPPDEGVAGSDDYDVFIQKTPYIAYCAPGAPAPSRPHGSASKMVLDPSIPKSALPLVASHEFHHAIQVGLRETGANIAESGAVYISGIERKGRAWHLTYSLGFNTFQADPEKSLDWQGEIGNYYPYGTALYLLYLEQVHGGAQDGSFVRSIWERMGEQAGPANYFEAIAERVDFDAAFEEFSRWRYFVGPLDDGQHFADLANWEGPDQTLDSVAVAAAHEIAALPLVDVPLARPVMPYGATYIQLGLAGLAPGERLAVDFSGDAAVRWSVALMLLGSDPVDEEVARADAQGRVTLEIDAAGRDQLVMVIANLGTPDYEPDGPTWDAFGASYSIRRLAPEDVGAGAGGGGGGGAGGSPDAEMAPEDDPGCACSLPRSGAGTLPAVPALVAIVVLAVRRGRKRLRACVS